MFFAQNADWFGLFRASLDIDNMRHLYEKFKCGACWQPIYVADRDLIEPDVGLVRTLFVSLGADVE